MTEKENETLMYLKIHRLRCDYGKKTTAKILQEREEKKQRKKEIEKYEKKHRITCTEEPNAQMPENKRERARTFFVVFYFVHELMCTQCIKGKNSYRFKFFLIFFCFWFINFICHRTEYITCKCGTYA